MAGGCRKPCAAMARALPAGSQVFMIELVAKPGTDGVRALRALIKIALRSFDLRCIEAREVE